MQEELRLSSWLPTTNKEVKIRGWEYLDVILFSGDAYVDHPTFGPAVIGRLLESMGLRVAIVPQPNVKDNLQDFVKLGKPRLFFGVTGGCMDPMISNYNANKKRRDKDAYTPNGEIGFRPDYASTVYSKILKEKWPDTPVLIGGIEGSLRRVTHYDYWSDQLMPTILETSKADMLVYGMGEQPLREIVRLLERGVPFNSINTVNQTAILINDENDIPKNKNWEDVEIASHETCLKDKKAYASNFKVIEQESNKLAARRIFQKVGKKILMINPPYPTMTEAEIDASFDLPYTRLPHPKYNKRGPIPAYEMIKTSINIHRGCFGGCSFCTISAHQGKFIASRSKESILREVDKVANMPDFKGYLSDIGGPSANMYQMKGKVQSICDKCVAPSCISPVICSNLDTSHKPLTELYQAVDSHPKVKKSFIGSGIRHDMLVPEFNKNADPKELDDYTEEVMTKHVSGRLKVAPEHTSDPVLKLMRKPSFSYFHKFKERFDKINIKNKLNLQLIPYFISNHPACEVEDMANLAAETKDMGFQLEQVQGFTPTPMTVATVIYYSGYHPYTLKKVNTPKTRKEKDEQHRFFFWYKDENKAWIKNTLNKLGRQDLLDVLLPKKDEKWRKNKPGKTKNTFNDAVPFNQRKNKVKYKKKKRK
ncbi:putative radical SAM protein YgiQ [Mesoflavibacter sabulilitoris]|uniref:YgiQ family radical SAM protein n=1 Tax=Mesoflavibacter zeaxanthinifaciens subsp. sabulilitoris TaxID=1520893 RepID=A0A2T1NIF4_9FLAO|nr:YgiQ family radical SAM protein [Mesoflavibacter zeaxanthinifaciens]MBB3124210.1 putative radical SAM protein YgiQ [Mesoflavibacter zeaxanthinifaciens subsp. sabulilitoris]PSG92681.1 YgiQ family radical SAM protein [Mesoflavibacter zeaxanthinifaciens subsp. sabulilitoris]